MKTYYYKDYDEDIIKNKNQDIELKNNYKWIHKNIVYKVYSFIVYVIFFVFGLFYTKVILHVSIKNKKVLKNRSDYFLFMNHTQVMGDAFIPALISFPKRAYVVANKANLGIPVLGKFLPALGAIVVPENLHDYKKFIDALKYYKGVKVIYPEAHVWPYYTKIRPFASTSFKLAYELEKDIFSATVTYKKRKYFKKPKIVIYIDGPFEVRKSESKKSDVDKICCNVRDVMIKRSKNNNIEYVRYKKMTK